MFSKFKQNKNESILLNICSYIQRITLDLIIQKRQMLIQNTPQTTKYMFNNPLFPKVHKFGAPQASPDSFRAKKLICRREKIRPMRLH